MVALIEKVNGFVWGIPALVLIIGIGIYLSVISGFAQVRYFPLAVRRFAKQIFTRSKETHGISGFRAMCTALAATVGTGNIVGVAGAIAVGGPGSIFWMWICAFLGMVTKFAEATLSVRYRMRDRYGRYIGGPMHMIQRGMSKRWHWMAYLYSFFGLVASFGVGNATQINAVIGGIHATLNSYGVKSAIPIDFIIGIILAAIISVMLMGGMQRISKTAEFLVPFVSCGYLLIGMAVLCFRFRYIPEALSKIVCGAFQPQSVTGGVLGSVFLTLRTGASRGVFTNEAGMGTAAMAHASADVSHPVEQGLMGIMEVFLDTIVICTMTALVILCSGVVVPYGRDVGVELTTNAFTAVLGQWVNIFIAIALSLFAFATILGWGLYGIRCTEFLFGVGSLRYFVIAQGCMVILGAVMKTETVWMLAETINGLMAIPNLVGLAVLSPELKRLVKDFKNNRRN